MDVPDTRWSPSPEPAAARPDPACSSARLATIALVLATLLAATPAAAADTTLVPLGATWKYLDDGTDQGTAWTGVGVDDSAWASGPAQLGYGDGDEATVVGFGPDANNKFVTTYFRHTFTVNGASAYTALEFQLLRDDGAVVYLNGTEIFRNNMPEGAIGHTTLASSTVGGSNETTVVTHKAAAAAVLLEGTNVVAVEIHQGSVTSSDISFDLKLSASDNPVVRGPYLQLGTPNSVTVRWRSLVDTDSVVAYGSSPDNLTSSVADATATTEHVVQLDGLDADTKYYYSVGASGGTHAGGDAEHFFVTAPAPGTAKNTRVWVIGDSGTANANARAVRDAYLAFTGSRHTDLWLMLGDNAYNDGTDDEYQGAVFDMYASVLRTSVLWPTLGNHDGHSADSDTLTGPYYDIFTLPTLGEAGGEPSLTEAYYSFDYGNIHFVCLDSYDIRGTSTTMQDWLADDLLAAALDPNTDWLIAFWHHPPYSKGSHDSDTETRLIEMRENILPILEDYGVDIVLSGHSHSYERSVLLDSHYGTSNTLIGSMILDGGDGRPSGNGAYVKATRGLSAHEGAVYVVAGSSGKISGVSMHPVMYVWLNELGSVVLDIGANVLQATFIDNAGAALDNFTIVKGPSPEATPTPTQTPTSTPTLTPTATPAADAVLAGAVRLQGYPTPPHDSWIVPLSVSLTPAGAGAATSCTPQTDADGLFSCVDIFPGSYSICAKHSRTLSNCRATNLTSGSNNVDFGLLRQGDADDNDCVQLLDFSILAGSFAHCSGDEDFDARADMNADGCVVLMDFSLLASNFGQCGDGHAAAGGAAARPKRAPSTPFETGAQIRLTAPDAVPAGITFDVVVHVDAGETAIDGAAAYVDFDPAVLDVVALAPADHLPLILDLETDRDAGTVGLAAATLGTRRRGTLELGRVTFRSRQPSRPTALRLHRQAPRISDVSAGGRSVLDTLAGVSLTVEAVSADCTGDCNGDGEVTVDELTRLVRLATGAEDGGCVGADRNRDARITVDEVLAAVGRSLLGCPKAD
jgi:hypothetical protein